MKSYFSPDLLNLVAEMLTSFGFRVFAEVLLGHSNQPCSPEKNTRTEI
jgi:hypothetical protein